MKTWVIKFNNEKFEEMILSENSQIVTIIVFLLNIIHFIDKRA